MNKETRQFLLGLILLYCGCHGANTIITKIQEHTFLWYDSIWLLVGIYTAIVGYNLISKSIK